MDCRVAKSTCLIVFPSSAGFSTCAAVRFSLPSVQLAYLSGVPRSSTTFSLSGYVNGSWRRGKSIFSFVVMPGRRRDGWLESKVSYGSLQSFRRLDWLHSKTQLVHLTWDIYPHAPVDIESSRKPCESSTYIRQQLLVFDFVDNCTVGEAEDHIRQEEIN
eukprot:COSAG02_NODE_7401_length_3034_cov_3.660307_5_plen_160_part_00